METDARCCDPLAAGQASEGALHHQVLVSSLAAAAGGGQRDDYVQAASVLFKGYRGLAGPRSPRLAGPS
ncbi:hypothetical protein EYF80_054663 [Liparis tanakae]|uniref:Uncharacterized protein n=1 Tax=Liparis tanakae TaxID=230148 RepID=A0A4Z2F208_9TELE|nr:hypothetical protein EYF80_054663 [Liparis tanakae]